VVRKILALLKKHRSRIKFVKDRPGHDFRYALDSTKIKNLGWKPAFTFDRGIEKTIDWYLRYEPWLENKVVYLLKYWKKVYK